MPLDVEFTQPPRFWVRASGEVTLPEIEDMLRGMLAHPGLPGADVLVDATDIQGVPSTGELRVAARDLLPVRDHGLGALCIVSANPFVYGVSRMFSVFADAVGAKVGAFRNFDDAYRWLADQRTKVNAPGT